MRLAMGIEELILCITHYSIRYIYIVAMISSKNIQMKSKWHTKNCFHNNIMLDVTKTGTFIFYIYFFSSSYFIEGVQ